MTADANLIYLAIVCAAVVMLCYAFRGVLTVAAFFTLLGALAVVLLPVLLIGGVVVYVLEAMERGGLNDFSVYPSVRERPNCVPYSHGAHKG
ncbi:hypothetical protein [Pseudovibrio sp. SPO723]|uniref:hypothetical protein n=1 Tax=Nesiotobacter zosterae TaxID=392721 RepID=UPI0029C45FC4|nr:hypothetical protein [Pseudovibrio sp. SPO723]MDX5592563.1 hypothetical protein [Pseudovibrio sp. SPO723]